MATKEEQEKNREKVLNRARKNIRLKVNSNVFQWTGPDGKMAKPKFLTLTFRQNVTDISWANNEFKKYVKRLQRYLRQEVKYLAVVEFQKRGAIHYHVIMFNLPYIKELDTLEKVWGHGVTNLKAIKKVDNLGAYLCKYLTKATAEKLKGEKSYFTSRGLKQPEVIKDEKKIDMLETCLGVTPKFEGTYENQYIGKLNYKQYNLNSQEVSQREHKNVKSVHKG